MKSINELYENMKRLITESSESQKVSEAIINNQEKVNPSNEIQYKLSPEETEKLSYIFFESRNIKSDLNEQLIIKVGIKHEMEDLEKINQEIKATEYFEINPYTKEKEHFCDSGVLDEYYKKADEIRAKIGLYLEDKNVLMSGESCQFLRVKKDPDLIRNIIEPTEKIQLTAIYNDPNSIKYIRNPTAKVQLIAVKKDPSIIRYIKNPTEEVQLIAVKQDPYLIWAFKNPTPKVQLAAGVTLNKELYSSSSKALIADVFSSPDERDEVRNYRILDKSTGKTDRYLTNDIDLNKQPIESIKKLLSGNKVEMTDKSGISNLVKLNKGVAGWTISAAKQIVNTADESAGIQ